MSAFQFESIGSELKVLLSNNNGFNELFRELFQSYSCLNIKLKKLNKSIIKSMKNISIKFTAALSLLSFLILSGPVIGGQNLSLHDFKVTDIYGDTFDLSQLKGKKVLVVNTASECGLTPQYEALEKLYRTYKDEGFMVVGFPANNFMNQEPGTNQEIITFCEENYGVSFPMMSKISVKGDDIHPLYKWLTSKSQNGVMDSEVSWNFQKYLLDEDGQLVKYFPPRHDPLSEEITGWITH